MDIFKETTEHSEIKLEEIEILDELKPECSYLDFGEKIPIENIEIPVIKHEEIGIFTEPKSELHCFDEMESFGSKHTIDVFKEKNKNEEFKIPLKSENCYKTDGNLDLNVKKETSVCYLPDLKQETNDNELLLGFNSERFISNPEKEKYHYGKCYFCGKYFSHKLLKVHHFYVYHYCQHAKNTVKVGIKKRTKKQNKTYLNLNYLHYKNYLKMFQQNRLTVIKNRKSTFPIRDETFIFKLKSKLNSIIFHNREKPANSSLHLKLRNEKLFKCNICSKPFSYLSSLKQHQRVHTDKNRFKCNICLKPFSNSYHLKRHQSIHTDEKPFKCDICWKFFKTDSNLKSHLRVHTDEKPFKCYICSKLYTRKDYLKSHLRSHTGEKPFKCNICSKYFTQKSNLNAHKKIHTGEKPFNCEICSQRFLSNNHLKSHLRIHVAEKPFKCDICLKYFTQNCNLKTHLRKTHLKIHTSKETFNV